MFSKISSINLKQNLPSSLTIKQARIICFVATIGAIGTIIALYLAKAQNVRNFLDMIICEKGIHLHVGHVAIAVAIIVTSGQILFHICHRDAVPEQKVVENQTRPEPTSSSFSEQTQAKKDPPSSYLANTFVNESVIRYKRNLFKKEIEKIKALLEILDPIVPTLSKSITELSFNDRWSAKQYFLMHLQHAINQLREPLDFSEPEILIWWNIQEKLEILDNALRGILNKTDGGGPRSPFLQLKEADITIELHQLEDLLPQLFISKEIQSELSSWSLYKRGLKEISFHEQKLNDSNTDEPGRIFAREKIAQIKKGHDYLMGIAKKRETQYNGAPSFLTLKLTYSRVY